MLPEHVGIRFPGLGIKDRSRRDAVDPGADRVEMDLQRLDRFCGGVRRNLAGVIFSIGQENNDAAFRSLSFNRFAAAAMPEPMAVPSSTSPICTRSRFSEANRDRASSG